MADSFYSFWLIPQAPDLAYFQDIINTLAKDFGTVSFCPHVTLYSGALPPSVTVEHVCAGLTSVGPLALEVANLRHESRFSKSLYVQLNPAAPLTQLVKRLVAAISTAQPPRLDPHLSLLYHRLAPAMQQRLADSIPLPHPMVQFDQVHAIAAPQTFETQADVASLRCVYRQLLTTP